MIDHLGHKNKTIMMGPGVDRLGHYCSMGRRVESLVVVA